MVVLEGVVVVEVGVVVGGVVFLLLSSSAGPAKSRLLPTKTTTMPSSAIWRRSWSHSVACSKVERRVMS